MVVKGIIRIQRNVFEVRTLVSTGGLSMGLYSHVSCISYLLPGHCQAVHIILVLGTNAEACYQSAENKSIGILEEAHPFESLTQDRISMVKFKGQ